MLLLPKSTYEIRTLKKTGRGVFARRDIEAGTLIGDYLGTIIKPDSNDENKTGLYDMRAGLKYDIWGDPKKEGPHLINHSCASNCEAYPYQGHILYGALRKIFKGEEITINYGLGSANENDVVCKKHACHCGMKICTGNMHEDEAQCDAWFDLWEAFIKKNFGEWYRKVPGPYGSELQPLASYPVNLDLTNSEVYPNIFGSEKKPAVSFRDATLPPLDELRTRIRKTGRRLSFPRLHMRIYGIKNHMIIAERI